MEPSFDVTGIGGNPHQGPHFVFHIRVVDGAAASVRFTSFSCMWSNLIGMTVSSLIEHRPLAVCASLSREEIIAKVGQVPRSKEELIGLACAALREAHQEAERRGLIPVADQGAPALSAQVAALPAAPLGNAT